MIDIRNTDCLDFLKTVDDNSVDHINVDPPYNIGFDGGKGWDKIENYQDWCAKWIAQLVRVLKPGRMLGVWGTLKDRQFFDTIRQIDDTGLIPQNEVIWSYNWGGRSLANFARKHEYCFFWSKGEEFLFNADEIRIERKMDVNIRTGKKFDKGTIPTCVWEKNNHTTAKEFCGWHSTTKNIEILERMILAYTNEGDTVLDCFSGSGSTALAAQKTNRNFIGSERDEIYYEKTLKRLEVD